MSDKWVSMSESCLWMRVTHKKRIKYVELPSFKGIAILINGFKYVALQGN